MPVEKKENGEASGKALSERSPRGRPWPSAMAVPIAVLDCDLLLYGRGHRTLDRFKLEDVTDEYLVSTYGFPRQFICYLVDLLGATLSRPTQRSRAISPETQILAALGFYTSGSFQTRMGDAIGISQASMSRCVANVTEALAALTSQFETELHKDGWLLGDSSFLLRTWLMTPLHIPETPAEYRYNMAHSATHNVIERTFRTIRSRFRCLDGSKGTLQYSPEKSSHIILACCVLHNISLQHGLDVWSAPATGHMEQSEEEYEQMESVDSEACRVQSYTSLS
ncbi:hypothetical protein IHE44_0014015 [Lamprotornis superbus]|uniref:Putative nuclease HARBI1 n=1 Tax=Lamprotornis superbus TaxID=245042 RepID=A0A835U2U3_9PASS|nr:hypothetical protein IHE44_0014015 [Lamprotornis superbus]